MPQLLRKGHFLGTKLRSVRKRNGLTLEELSGRCTQRSPRRAPSVSYWSMIESGKRIPSAELLALVAAVSKRPPAWFMDESADPELPPPGPGGAAAPVPLEPAFLFSRSLLQVAIPELLAQTGTSGRQFANLLIRSHQEISRNDFPDLERAADEVSERRFPLSAEDLVRLRRRHGLEIRWFDRKPVLARDKDRELRSMVRSFFEAPHVVYANRALQADPARLKFDLAAHIAHKVLHGGDGLKSAHATGGEMGGSPESGSNDPCPHWAVFRMMDDEHGVSGSRISVLRDGERSLLYCCHSRRVRDMAGNPHVLSVGVDLAPALASNGVPSEALIDSIFRECLQRRGEARVPKAAAQGLERVANVLNIAWIADALAGPARIICPRSNRCPRPERCEGARPSRAREVADVREEILGREG